MSRYRLRSYDTSPPGGYCYEQTEGIYKKFPCQPMAEAQAQAVAAFRTGNKLPRASVQECLQDVDHYNCQRLGNNPRWCCPADSGNVLPLNTSSPVIAPCKGCGAVIQ